MNEASDKEYHETLAIRERLKWRLEAQGHLFNQEIERLAKTAASLGVQKIILFGSMVKESPRLTSDVDLLIVWQTPLSFLERTVEMYRRLQPRVPVDLLVYTPEEVKGTISNRLVKRALSEGKVLYEA